MFACSVVAARTRFDDAVKVATMIVPWNYFIQNAIDVARARGQRVIVHDVAHHAQAHVSESSHHFSVFQHALCAVRIG